MAHRGIQAMRLRLWEVDQRRLGREDARAGRPASMADQHYQRGYREGSAPCQCDNLGAHPDTEGCQRKAVTKRYGLCKFCQRGHND